MKIARLAFLQVGGKRWKPAFDLVFRELGIQKEQLPFEFGVAELIGFDHDRRQEAWAWQDRGACILRETPALDLFSWKDEVAIVAGGEPAFYLEKIRQSLG